MTPGEADPHGKVPNEPGSKLDKGKTRVSLMESGFPRALMAVAGITTFGANKYTDGGWLQVPDAFRRYSDAGGRHRLKRLMGEELDPDSGHLHLAHEAWNALAILELALRERERNPQQRGEPNPLVLHETVSPTALKPPSTEPSCGEPDWKREIIPEGVPGAGGVPGCDLCGGPPWYYFGGGRNMCKRCYETLDKEGLLK